MKIFSPILKGTTTMSQGTTNLSGSFTGSLFGTAATASYADNFTVGGTLTAQTINVQIITSSIEFNTGSTRNGALLTNTHQFTGSVSITGSAAALLSVNNNILYVSSSGNVLIGTTTGDNYKLQIVGSNQATSTFGQTYAGVAAYSQWISSSNAFVMGFDGAAGTTARMTITSAGNVGIGTTSPSFALDVNGNGGNAYIRVNTSGSSNWSTLLLQNGDGSWHVTNDDTGKFNIGTGNDPSDLQKFTITSAGNVGIGTTSPSEKLVIYGTASSRPRLLVGPLTTSTLTYTTYNSQDNPAIEVNTSTTNGFAGLTMSNSDNTSGNTLGCLTFAAAGTSNGEKRGAIIASALEASAASSVYGNLIFYTATASSIGERMRISSDGNVGIGVSPLTKLHVLGGNVAALFTGNTGAINGYSGIVISARDAQDSNGQYGVEIRATNTQGTPSYLNPKMELLVQNNSSYLAADRTVKMTITGAGSIGAPSGTNIYNASDIRLKQNVSTTTHGLNTISLLNPVKFNWVDGFESSEDGKDMLGFVAQEVQTIIPEAVESFGGDINLNGEVIENPLRVNEKFIIPVLVKAIQELKSENDTLKEILQRNNIQ